MSVAGARLSTIVVVNSLQRRCRQIVKSASNVIPDRTDASARLTAWNHPNDRRRGYIAQLIPTDGVSRDSQEPPATTTK